MKNLMLLTCLLLTNPCFAAVEILACTDTSGNSCNSKYPPSATIPGEHVRWAGGPCGCYTINPTNNTDFLMLGNMTMPSATSITWFCMVQTCRPTL